MRAERARYEAEMANRAMSPSPPPSPRPMTSILERAYARVEQREAELQAQLGEHDPIGPVDMRADHELDPVDLVDPDEETSEHSEYSLEQRRRRNTLVLDEADESSNGDEEPAGAGSEGSEPDEELALMAAVNAPVSPPLPQLVFNFMGSKPSEQVHEEELYAGVSAMQLDDDGFNWARGLFKK